MAAEHVVLVTHPPLAYVVQVPDVVNPIHAVSVVRVVGALAQIASTQAVPFQ